MAAAGGGLALRDGAGDRRLGRLRHAPPTPSSRAPSPPRRPTGSVDRAHPNGVDSNHNDADFAVATHHADARTRRQLTGSARAPTVRPVRGVRAWVVVLLLLVGWRRAAGARTGRVGRGAGRAARRRGGERLRGADYNRAVELLTRAYEIRQVPALLYNLAKAYDKLGDVEHAYDTYRRYADSADADPKLKAQVRGAPGGARGGAPQEGGGGARRRAASSRRRPRRCRRSRRTVEPSRSSRRRRRRREIRERLKRGPPARAAARSLHRARPRRRRRRLRRRRRSACR